MTLNEGDYKCYFQWILMIYRPFMVYVIDVKPSLIHS